MDVPINPLTIPCETIFFLSMQQIVASTSKSNTAKDSHWQPLLWNRLPKLEIIPEQVKTKSLILLPYKVNNLR